MKKIVIKLPSKRISPLRSDEYGSQGSQSNRLHHCLSSLSFYRKKKSRLPPVHFDSPYTLLADNPPSISFTRDKRFRSYSNSNNNAQFCRPIWLKQSPSNVFGNEKRKDVFPGNKNPAPSDYKINTCFEDDYLHRKGYTLSPRYSTNKDKLNPPGPGSYNANAVSWTKQYPVSICSRRFIFFHDLIKNRTNVSPQKYHINYEPGENMRFKGIGLGIGQKTALQTNSTPGVGSYNLPSCFDMLRRTKYALN